MTESTVNSLVDVAEHHFAIDGFERASLRAMMREAETDPGAIHYHFGGRTELAAVVLDRVLAPLNARRLELLETLEATASHEPLDTGALVEALVRPDIELVHELEQRGTGRGRLIGAIYLDPARFVTEQVEARFGPVAARFHPHLLRALPTIAPELLGWRVRWCLFGTLGAIVADPTEPFQRPADELVDLLVSTISGALAATPIGHSLITANRRTSR